MRESSLDLLMTGEWCPRERFALLHAIIKHLNTFSILFCFWGCFCGLLPFFLIIVFSLFSFCWFFCFVLWAVNYPSFKCPLTNDTSKIQDGVEERLVSWCLLPNSVFRLEK